MQTLKTGTNVCNSDFDKADALNEHFPIVLTNLKATLLFDDVSPFESIPSINANGVLSQFKQLYRNKANCPDKFSP